MEQSMKMKTFTLVLGASLLVPLPASHAADMVVKISKTTSLAAEETVAISLEKFPAKAGVYLQQCQELLPIHVRLIAMHKLNYGSLICAALHSLLLRQSP